MTIEIDKNKMVVRKSNLVFILVNYGTLEDLQKWISIWIEAEMRLK